MNTVGLTCEFSTFGIGTRNILVTSPANISVKRGLTLTILIGRFEHLPVLFEACHVLQEVSFRFNSYAGWILGWIPSNSVSLIRLYDLWGMIVDCSTCCIEVPDYPRLGASIREVARRFSNHHRGLKTRVQVISSRENAQAVGNKETSPPVMAEFEEELGTHVTLELAHSDWLSYDASHFSPLL